MLTTKVVHGLGWNGFRTPSEKSETKDPRTPAVGFFVCENKLDKLHTK